MNFNWWQTILLGVVVLAIGVGVGHYIWQEPVKTMPNTYATGQADTTISPALSPIKDSVITITHLIRDTIKVDTTSVTIESYYEAIVDTSIDSTSIYIRSRTYPYTENDTLKAKVDIEYNIQPKTIQITRVDTIYVPQVLREFTSFTEKPAIVGSIAFIVGVLTTIIIINSVRSK